MTNNIRWGLDNPHPFSQMKTELIWDGYNRFLVRCVQRVRGQHRYAGPGFNTSVAPQHPVPLAIICSRPGVRTAIQIKYHKSF